MFESKVEERPDHWVEGDPEPPADLLWELTTEAESSEPEEITSALPAGLADWMPAPYLGVILSGIQVDRLSGHGRVVVLKALQKMSSHYGARVYEAMASIGDAIAELDTDPEFSFEVAAMEIRAALKLTPRTAERELGMAYQMCQDHPRVAEKLAAGDIDFRRAKTLIYQTAHLDDETTERVFDEVLDQASELTTGQLTARIRKLAIAVNPDEAEDRYQHGLEERKVYAQANLDGTADYIGINLAPDRVTAAQRRIDRIAKSLKTKDDPRTIDQIRADVYLDILCGRTVGHQSNQAVTDIRVDLETLTGQSENPGEIPGWGPVLADVARQVAARQENGEWRVTVVHPKTRIPLASVTTSRRPTRHQTRQIHAQHPTCVAPGCRMPADACDIDHNIPWADSEQTDNLYLAPLCRRDHNNRHHGWTYVINTDGTITWTSPLGHTYTTRPEHPP
jgi:hypothetical protein